MNCLLLVAALFVATSQQFPANLFQRSPDIGTHFSLNAQEGAYGNGQIGVSTSWQGEAFAGNTFTISLSNNDDVPLYATFEGAGISIFGGQLTIPAKKSATAELTLEETFGKGDLIISNQKQEMAIPIYAYRNGETSYASFNKESARAFEFLIDKNDSVFSPSEYQDFMSFLHNEEEAKSVALPANSYFSGNDLKIINGRATWSNEYDEVIPLPFAKISILPSLKSTIGTLLFETYADENGYFSFDLSGSEPFIDNGEARIWATLETSNMVLLGDGNADLRWEYSNVSFGATKDGSAEYNLHFNWNGDYQFFKYAPAFIGLAYAHKYAEENHLGFNDKMQVFLNWPCTSFYNPIDRSINLELGLKDQSVASLVETALHEYGHRVAHANNLTQLLPATHTFTENKFLNGWSEQSSSLAFQEGFASFFAMVVMHYSGFKQYASLLDYGLTDYSIYSANDLNIADGMCVPGDKIYAYGHGVEYNVAAILWNLFDGLDTGSNSWDAVDIDDILFWTYLKNYENKPMLGLNYALDALSSIFNLYDLNEEVGKILSVFNCSPNLGANLTEKTYSASKAPSFKWFQPGSLNGNWIDRFSIILESIDGSYTYEKDIVYPSSAGDREVKWEPSTAEWSTIWPNVQRGLKWYVIGAKDDCVAFGEWRSANQEILMPFSSAISFKASDFDGYFENEGNGYYVPNSTEAVVNLDGIDVSTIRKRCSYIENSELVLSSNREGAGEAFLELNFNKDILRVDFDVSLWSGKEFMAATQTKFFVQYKSGDGSFKNSLELKETDLPSDRSKKQRFSSYFYNEANHSIRFYETSELFSYPDSNKSRICLDNFTVYFA